MRHDIAKCKRSSSCTTQNKTLKSFGGKRVFLGRQESTLTMPTCLMMPEMGAETAVSIFMALSTSSGVPALA